MTQINQKIELHETPGEYCKRMSAIMLKVWGEKDPFFSSKESTLVLPMAYISGKITNMPNLNRHKFAAAEILVRKIGYKPVNPHRLPADHDKTWASYMKACIKALVVCDCVFVLDDWKYSKGAVREVFIASFLGMTIFSLETLQPIKLSFLTKLKMILNLA